MTKTESGVETEAKKFGRKAASMINNSGLDPVITLRARINELYGEHNRVDLVQVVHDTDTSYSQSYDEKQKIKRAIMSKIRQNEFAVNILLNLSNFEK